MAKPNLMRGRRRDKNYQAKRAAQDYQHATERRSITVIDEATDISAEQWQTMLDRVKRAPIVTYKRRRRIER